MTQRLAETYRGWTVEKGPDGNYYAFGPDYEASTDGGSDFTGNGQSVCGANYDDMRDQIDTWFVENGQFGVGA